ncbi:hypothetical protein EGI11_02555 [Chryseobacterium sp. H3056]|uniref:Uncharacterized protein n=1 Tax=Kaistella daneshvariae TaxID=2487074 RepID=A0A3N0X1N4_9FLAO|nr:hypothetical protein EGI11_02555 [Kaistella daneshvariae]
MDAFTATGFVEKVLKKQLDHSIKYLQQQLDKLIKWIRSQWQNSEMREKFQNILSRKFHLFPLFIF